MHERKKFEWSAEQIARYDRVRKLIREKDVDGLAAFLAEDMTPATAALISAAKYREENPLD